MHTSQTNNLSISSWSRRDLAKVKQLTTSGSYARHYLVELTMGESSKCRVESHKKIHSNSNVKQTLIRSIWMKNGMSKKLQISKSKFGCSFFSCEHRNFTFDTSNQLLEFQVVSWETKKFWFSWQHIGTNLWTLNDLLRNRNWIFCCFCASFTYSSSSRDDESDTRHESVSLFITWLKKKWEIPTKVMCAVDMWLMWSMESNQKLITSLASLSLQGMKIIEWERFCYYCK